MRAFILRALVLLAAIGAAGCEGEIVNIPTTPDPVTVTDTFTGRLTVNGAQTHNVFTGATGLVTATITSLGETAPEKVGFSMGTLSSVGTCTVIVHNDNAVVQTALTGTVANLNGTLCVRIFDVGSMTAPVDYTLTVSHP
jgi:hypothetical protein